MYSILTSCPSYPTSYSLAKKGITYSDFMKILQNLQRKVVVPDVDTSVFCSSSFMKILIRKLNDVDLQISEQ